MGLLVIRKVGGPGFACDDAAGAVELGFARAKERDDSGFKDALGDEVTEGIGGIVAAFAIFMGVDFH